MHETTALHERLSGLDSAFLSLETGTAHMHVTGVFPLRLEGTAPLAFASRFRDLLRARMGELPPLRRKLAHAPFDLDHANWIEAEEVDLDYHVRRAALPEPGSQRELAQEVARIAAQPLDRSRPLWEVWLLEGLEGDRLALVTKLHHAAIDGVAGAELMARVFDFDPDAPLDRGASPRPDEDEPEVAPTGLAGALVRLAAKPASFAGELARTGFVLARAGLALGGHVRRATLPFTGPSTPFNTPITPHRSVAFARVELDGLRRARRVLGAKLNDLVLTACTGSLRRYLQLRGELPDAPLVATIPVAVDARDGRAAGNGVSAMFAALPVQLEDPLEQLREVRRATSASKRAHASLATPLLARWVEWIPPVVLAKATDLYSALGLSDRHGPVHSVIVSNVKGPSAELYCAGLAVEAGYPLGPIYDGGALNLTVLSYAGFLHFGANACPEAAPELDELAEGFRDAVEELVAVAERRRREQSARPRRPVAAPAAPRPAQRAEAAR